MIPDGIPCLCGITCFICLHSKSLLCDIECAAVLWANDVHKTKAGEGMLIDKLMSCSCIVGEA